VDRDRGRRAGGVLLQPNEYALKGARRRPFIKSAPPSILVIIVSNREDFDEEAGYRERITIRLSARHLRALSRLVEQGHFNSRNEAIRAGIRLVIEKYQG
jgi:hypothetical protein